MTQLFKTLVGLLVILIAYFLAYYLGAWILNTLEVFKGDKMIFSIWNCVFNPLVAVIVVGMIIYVLSGIIPICNDIGEGIIDFFKNK